MTGRERLAYLAASLAGAAAGVGVWYGWRGRRKASALSQVEIDAIFASDETTLATDEDVADDCVAVACRILLHEAPPNSDEPWFWYAIAAGGPDPRYAMRTLRSSRGFARTKPAARIALQEAIELIAQSDDAQEPAA